MADQTERATVPHDRGEATPVARALIDLADDPRDVVYLAGQSAFSVPDTVAEAYRKSLASSSTKRRTAPKKEAE